MNNFKIDMRMKLFYVAFFLILAQVIYCQDTRLNDGFVISINNEIVGGITAPKLVLVEAGKMRSINIDYIPGDLFFFNPNDKTTLMSDTIGKVTLDFYYSYYKRDRQFTRHYEIPICKEWLKYSFAVLGIHNFNKRKDKYYYSWIFPGYSLAPTKKIVRKMKYSSAAYRQRSEQGYRCF